MDITPASRGLNTGDSHGEQVERFGEHAADGSCTDQGSRHMRLP